VTLLYFYRQHHKKKVLGPLIKPPKKAKKRRRVYKIENDEAREVDYGFHVSELIEKGKEKKRKKRKLISVMLAKLFLDDDL